jgi:predicted small lipoprotein YifL
MMKHMKVWIAALLLASFLLAACGQTGPAETGTPAAEPLRETASSEPMVLQPLAASINQVDPTTVQSDMFRAKFEGSEVAGSGEAVDGVYRFIATETDGEAWHVKLECNYPTVAGRDYRVTYRFRSDVAGKVKFGDFQEFEIKEGDNSVSGILIASGGTSYLDLQLGMLPPFTIDFTEIQVEEYADEVDYEDALPTPTARANAIMNGFSDADWDKLQSDLQAYKLDEYLAIFQKYIDAFYA